MNSHTRTVLCTPSYAAVPHRAIATKQMKPPQAIQKLRDDFREQFDVDQEELENWPACLPVAGVKDSEDEGTPLFFNWVRVRVRARVCVCTRNQAHPQERKGAAIRPILLP